ncbi:DUF2789 family protein [Dechloromonas agitata]
MSLPNHERNHGFPSSQPGQAAFLRDEWRENDDWAEAVDELSLRLHS